MMHPVMWFEVLGNDGGRLQKFYGDLFGWTFDVIQPINYGVAKTGDSRGISGGDRPDLPRDTPVGDVLHRDARRDRVARKGRCAWRKGDHPAHGDA